METVEKVISNLSAADIDQRLEEQLVDGILYSFQEQTGDDSAVMLNGFGTIVNALGGRTTVPPSDLRHDQVAVEQQVGRSEAAGGGSDLEDRDSHAHV